MKKSNNIFISMCFLFMGIIFFGYSCSDNKKTSKYYIYNPLTDSMLVKIDGNPIKIPPDSILQQKIILGKHLFEYRDKSDSFEISADSRLLINPLKTTVIKQEILYGNSLYMDSKVDESDYFNPFIVFKLDSFRYFGPFVITDTVFISGWLFNINEPIQQTMPESPGGWSKSGLGASNYKLYSIKEVKEKITPLNFTEKYIDQIFQKSLVYNNPKGYIRVFAKGIYAGATENDAASLGKLYVTESDNLCITEPYLYDPKEHGKIIQTFFTLKNCNVEISKDKIVYNRDVLLIEAKESNILRLIIR